jgi:hypothetical protein
VIVWVVPVVPGAIGAKIPSSVGTAIVGPTNVSVTGWPAPGCPVAVSEPALLKVPTICACAAVADTTMAAAALKKLDALMLPPPLAN